MAFMDYMSGISTIFQPPVVTGPGCGLTRIVQHVFQQTQSFKQWWRNFGVGRDSDESN